MHDIALPFLQLLDFAVSTDFIRGSGYNGWCRYDNRAEMSTTEKNTDAARANANNALSRLTLCDFVRRYEDRQDFIVLTSSHTQKIFAYY